MGALILLFVPKENKNAIRWMAKFSPSPASWSRCRSCRCSGRSVDATQHFKFIEGVPNNWIPSIGAGYVLGIDGISFLLIMLTTLLGWISILSSWTAIENRVKEYYIWFLLLQTGMLGVFMSLDFFLFYVFWEAMLVPMYLLIGIWGGPRKLYAAIKFFLYTLAGSVLMLLGILFLYFHHHSGYGNLHIQPAGDLRDRAEDLFRPARSTWQRCCSSGLLLRVRHQGADVPLPHLAAGRARGSADGRFGDSGRRSAEDGDLRVHPLLASLLSRRARTAKVRGWMIVLSIIGIIYGALVSLMQKDMKKLVAYSSVSHLGFCTLGIFVLTPLGLSGSVLQQINHGISTGALFLIVGILYERRHTREISEYGGISNVMPVYATITMIMFLSSMGLPLLNGFIGEYSHPAGHIHGELELGRMGRARRSSGRGVFAVAIPASVLWYGDQPKE